MKKSQKTTTYVNSGVNIAKANKLIRNFKKTNFIDNLNVIEGIGGFSSLYKLNLKKFENPIIVSSTDGVGTKLLVARDAGIYRGLGQDLVAMNVDPEDFGLASSGEPELPLFSLPAEGQGAGDTPGLVRAAGEVTQRVLNGEGGEPLRRDTIVG